MEDPSRDNQGGYRIKKKKLKEDMKIIEQKINSLVPRVDRMTHPCDRREGLRQISDAKTRLDVMAGQYKKLP